MNSFQWTRLFLILKGSISSQCSLITKPDYSGIFPSLPSVIYLMYSFVFRIPDDFESRVENVLKDRNRTKVSAYSNYSNIDYCLAM